MDINKKSIQVHLNSEDIRFVDLRWFRGANRYNNGATRYKGRHQFRFVIGKSKQIISKRSQDSNQSTSDKQ